MCVYIVSVRSAAALICSPNSYCCCMLCSLMCRPEGFLQYRGGICVAQSVRVTRASCVALLVNSWCYRAALE